MKRLFALLTALLLLTGCSQLETPPEDEDILFPLEEQADTTEATALPEVFSLPYLSTQPPQSPGMPGRNAADRGISFV